MKRKVITAVFSIIHILFWVIVMVASIVGKLSYKDPAVKMEPLEIAFLRGIYNVFILIAVCGIITATVLFFSLRAVFSYRNVKQKRLRTVALWFAAIAALLFYLCVVLLFRGAPDLFVIVPILLWLSCELCCGVLLLVSATGNCVRWGYNSST